MVNGSVSELADTGENQDSFYFFGLSQALDSTSEIASLVLDTIIGKPCSLDLNG